MENNNKVAAVIMAAGHGKRMKSDLPKVLHEVGGKPLVCHVINQAKQINADPIIVVVGHGREQVIPVVADSSAGHVVQEEQLGTGHAVTITEKAFENYTGDILVLSGDVPLLRGETLSHVLAYHNQNKATATVITAITPDPTGYGRVLRDANDNVTGIREHKDCSEEELKINEINSGIYLFKAEYLFEALSKLDNQNAQGEYYLTDVFKQFFDSGVKVCAVVVDFDEIHGINTQDDLAAARRIFEQDYS